jgi:starch synthase (maltosyl-transferring)
LTFGTAPERAGTNSEQPIMLMPEIETAVSPPAIYYFHPLLGGELASWESHLDRCSEMGFTHVLTAPPFRPGRLGNLFLTADYESLHPQLGSDQPASTVLAAFAERCHRRGMALWLDLVLDRTAADARIAREHPAWFAADISDHLPDPRIVSTWGQSAAFDFGGESAGPILSWWMQRVSDWLKAGVTGFRLERPQTVPPDFVRKLIAAAKAVRSDCRFMAWTPGFMPAELARLKECGLDFSVSSTCWWDFRSDWYADELARLAAVAPPLALSEAPFGSRISDFHGSSAGLDQGYRRLIRFSATSEAGWLMPMGFEYADAKPLDPIRADPAAFERLAETSNISFVSEIADANASASLLHRSTGSPIRWTALSAPLAPILAEITVTTAGGSDRRWLRLVNTRTDKSEAVDAAMLLARSGQGLTLKSPANRAETRIELAPAEVRLLDLEPTVPIMLSARQSKRQAATAARAPCVVIGDISPSVEGGRYAVKRAVGEQIVVTANIFSEGHGELAADLLWRPADQDEWRRRAMQPLGNDRWSADFRPDRVGGHFFSIEAWQDDFATLQNGLLKKRDAGLDIDLEIAEACRFLEKLAVVSASTSARLNELRDRLARSGPRDRLAILVSADTREIVRNCAERHAVTRQEPVIAVTVDRGKAVFSSWYELFPRSQSGTPERHGTFDDVIRRLPDIAAMGFDTLYFPPIHPIGRVNRKGRNNAPKARPEEPGSPYAIGSEEGGHDAIHPQLGTFDDFRRLRDVAARHGLEIALDFAIQCAPDHPWLKAHPAWFAWRLDGSLAFAENPPKKYEDIVNVDFHAVDAVPDLWLALRDIVLLWCREGIATFRVDNPHTKPFSFWRWLIADIRARYPDTIFLSEAFTRPQVMYQLAKLGFTQSYTYFTWRNTKAELESYFTELTARPPRDFFRPHLFVNTPDINPVFLQRSGRPGFLIRAALAATLSGLWGMYSGFELCEATPLPGREEYLDSEKYEIRTWDWSRPGNIKAEIALLNRLRSRNPALQSHLGLKFHSAGNDNILYYRKATPEGDNVLLIAVNLDPYHAHEAVIEVPLWEWGLPDHAAVDIEDLVGGSRFTWHGKHQSIRLDPHKLPFAVWRVATPMVGQA